MKPFCAYLALFAITLGAAAAGEKLVPSVSLNLPNASLIEALGFKRAYHSSVGPARWGSALCGCAIITDEALEGKSTRVRAVAIYVSIDDGNVYAHIDGRGEVLLNLRRTAVKAVKKGFGSRIDYPAVDAAFREVYSWERLEEPAHGGTKGPVEAAKEALSSSNVDSKPYDSKIVTAGDGVVQGLVFRWVENTYFYDLRYGIFQGIRE